VWITSVTDVENLYSPRRKSGQCSTEMYHQLLVHCPSVKVCLFQNHPSFSLDCDKEEEMYLNTMAIYFKRSGIFVQHTLNHRQNFLTSSRDLKMLKNNAELLPSRLNSGIF
jgi:hypothetical protein